MDRFNRLTSATYLEIGQRPGNDSIIGRPSYSTQYTYGPDSRPLTVRRNGVTLLLCKPTSKTLEFGEVDNLTFTYSGPHLVKVYDSAADVVYTGAADFCDAADLAVEYTYDANGNTTSDANKGITSIEYNALNLPAKITFTDGSRMENTYSADGTLLRRYTNVSVTHTPPILHAFSGGIGTQLPHVIEASDDHIGPLTYHNGSLKRIDTPNGFIDSEGEIYYYVKDYQGNIRQVTDADGTVLQDNHYYPYGMLMAESSDILAANRRSVPSILSPSSPATVSVSNPYLFGGKEYLTFKGANYLDFTARIYDNTTLTFGTPDPLRNDYTDINAHLYCAGNPVMFIDPTGEKIRVNKEDQQNVLDELVSTFGETGQNFYYDDDNFLQFKGKAGDLSNEQEKLFNGLNDIIKDKDITDLFLGPEVVYKDKDGTDHTLKASKGGGAFTILKKEDSKFENNIIIIDPSIKEFTVQACTDEFYKEPIDPLGKARFEPTSVKTSMGDMMFHEFGHILNLGKSQDKVIDYNNHYRKIKGMESRPYDENHNIKEY